MSEEIQQIIKESNDPFKTSLKSRLPAAELFLCAKEFFDEYERIAKDFHNQHTVGDIVVHNISPRAHSARGG